MVGKRLKEILFDHIYVSNLSRAIETCDIVTSNFNQSIKIQMDPDLAEGKLFFTPIHLILEKKINGRFPLQSLPRFPKSKGIQREPVLAN